MFERWIRDGLKDQLLILRKDIDLFLTTEDANDFRTAYITFWNYGFNSDFKEFCISLGLNPSTRSCDQYVRFNPSKVMQKRIINILYEKIKGYT